MRKRICIISMSVAIERDGRVLRQIEYLSRHFDITMIGYGRPDPNWRGVTWREVDRSDSAARKLIDRALLIVGRLLPQAYDLWLWTRPRYRQILRFARESKADAFQVNDWAVVPLALAAADAIATTGRRPYVFYDIHEYWELESEHIANWRRFFSPLVRYIHRKYAVRVDASSTVCAPIADRYREELGLNPTLIYSAPVTLTLPQRAPDPSRIRLVAHGVAARHRHLETMIEAMPLIGARYTLDLMLVDGNDGAIQDLRALAARIAPERVHFREPVSPPEIPATLSEYDIGLVLIPPTVYNYRVAMPNKLFESIAAGLAVVIGPSPAMLTFVNTHHCGWATDGFSAEDLAALLTRLTIDQIGAARQAARRAASEVNADTEMGKLIDIHTRLMGERE